ncbi:adenosine deaminase/editase [Scenedesmus sp. NREL 46B-D3]|nr:adenosine deaminase/editase [Scenedesmus sp. NREL 46B-D3]
MTATEAEHELAQLVAQTVQERFRSLPKSGKNQPHEHTVLAGIVAYFNAGAAAAQPLQQHSSCTATCKPTAVSPCTNMHVVAIGTGTKCLGASKRSAACDVINDSHAEVVTRRAFVAWVYHQLQLAAQLHKQCQQLDAASQQLQEAQQQQQPAVWSGTQLCQPAFVWCPDTGKFRLYSGVRFAMYVSQPPCGDASICSPEQQPSAEKEHQQHCQQELLQQPAAAGRTGAKLIRLSGMADVGQAAAATAGTATSPAGCAEDAGGHPSQDTQQQQQQQQQGLVPCVPCASDVEAGPQQLGVLRRKPGRGDPTLSLSCSDKLARWACLGLQGCLLSSCLAAPLHLDMLVVAVPPASTAAAAATDAFAAQPAAGAAAPAAAAAEDKHSRQPQQQEARLKAVEAAAARAFAGWLQGCAALLQPPFALRPPAVVAVQAADGRLGLYPDEARRSPSGVSINWSCQLPLLSAPVASTAKPSTAAAAGVHEVTLAAHGRKAGAGRNAPNWSNKKTRSRLCSAALYENWQALLAVLPAPPQASAPAPDAMHSRAADASGQHISAAGEEQRQDGQGSANAVNAELDIKAYRAEKQRVGQSYQQTWAALRNNSQSPFAGWLAKP